MTGDIINRSGHAEVRRSSRSFSFLPLPRHRSAAVTLISELQQVPRAARGGAVSVGNFDGVHRGHAALIRQLSQLAARLEGPAVAVTFDPHPAALLRPGSEPVRLTEIERRAELLGALGVSHLVVCKTDLALLRLTAREFFDSVLVDALGARGIVEGPNFFFGYRREGNVDSLATFCRQSGVVLEIAEALGDGNALVSSTEIRRRIAAGEIESANRLLTAPYRISGTVVRGDARGTSLGFPTANLTDIQTLIPAPGVYASRVELEDHSYAAATHIGPNPTFDPAGRSKVEIHIVDYQGDLYGSRLHVDFIGRVRDIARFDSIDLLVRQLERDVATVRRLDQHPPVSF